MKKLLFIGSSVLALLTNNAVAQYSPSDVPKSGGTFVGPFALGNTSGEFNLGSQQLIHWHKAIANVRNGGRGTLVFAGDSTCAGAGAGSGGTTNYNGAYATNAIRRFATLINSKIPVSDNSFFNDQSVPVAYGTYDTRVTLGTGWGNLQSSFGGNMFHFATGAAGTLGFTPVGQIDTFTVYWLQLSGNGSFTVNIDGAASIGTITTGVGATIVRATTFTVAKGAHTINLVATNDAAFYMLGVKAYDSTTPAIDIIQACSSGATVAAYVNGNGAWNTVNVLPFLAPDLLDIGLTINDSNLGTALSSYTSGLQTLIGYGQLSGDVVLRAGPPSNTVAATNGTLALYTGALGRLAVTNNSGFLDLTKRWRSYAYASPSFPYFDTLHPGVLGYWDIGSAMADAYSK